MKDSNVFKSVFAAFAILLISSGLYAQEYLLNGETDGTTITTCTGILYDSGGELGYYQNSENYIVTLCSDIEGTKISLYFLEFLVGEGYQDAMTIYDGDSDSSPILIGPIGGSDLYKKNITGSGSCITVKFVSNVSGNYNGFAAEISCKYGDCQNFIVDIAEISPNLLYPEIMMTDMCLGQEITLTATASFPENNIDYHQSMETLKWYWQIVEGNTFISEIPTENTNNLTYNTEQNGGFKTISFYAKDENGCISKNENNIIIRVPEKPNFSQSLVSDEVCLGELVTLNPVISSDSIYFHNNMAGVFKTTCMTDIPNVWQSVFFNFANAETNAVISQPSDIESVCMNMEHSFLGEININIVCPNGQSAILFKKNSLCNATYFGIPNETDDCTPGIGFDYCWTMSAESQMSSNCLSMSSLPAGNYLPFDNFSNLIGCPVNGEWVIKFMDDWGLDDGTIFSAQINFDSNLLPDNHIYIPSINTFDTSQNSTDVFWSGTDITPGILYQNVYPESTGNYDYILTATDNFGCTYDTTFSITVYEIGNPLCGPFCNSMVYDNDSDTINDGSGDYNSLNNTVCDWLITQPSKSGTDFFFYWNYFDVYEGDFLRIYAGNSDATPLLFEFTNSEVPESFVVPGTEVYISYSTNNFLRSPGWEMVYQTVPTASLDNINDEICIYPNPVSEIITITGMNLPATISIIDMSGRIVLKINNFLNSNLDMSNLENGVYFIKIEGENNQSFKVLKQ